MKKKLTAILLGAGHRGMYYASYANEFPGRLQIVGVADLSPLTGSLGEPRCSAGRQGGSRSLVGVDT